MSCSSPLRKLSPISPPSVTVLAHHALQCHWAMWGISTYTRMGKGSELTQVADAGLSDALCPADWTPVPK